MSSNPYCREGLFARNLLTLIANTCIIALLIDD
jgi:hypothetical protein